MLAFRLSEFIPAIVLLLHAFPLLVHLGEGVGEGRIQGFCGKQQGHKSGTPIQKGHQELSPGRAQAILCKEPESFRPDHCANLARNPDISHRLPATGCRKEFGDVNVKAGPDANDKKKRCCYRKDTLPCPLIRLFVIRKGLKGHEQQAHACPTQGPHQQEPPPYSLHQEPKKKQAGNLAPRHHSQTQRRLATKPQNGPIDDPIIGNHVQKHYRGNQKSQYA